MENNSPQNDNLGSTPGYEKPVTKKHEAMNTVQGSWLYTTTLYTTTLYSLYYTSLYYYH